MADKKELPLVLLEILQNYTDENHILSTKELIRITEDRYDLTMERRTLYANIDLLKKHGYKISTWQENGLGYYMEEHQFRKSEIFLLCNAIHSSHYISASESRKLIEKLLSVLSKYEKKEYTDKVYLPAHGKSDNELLLNNIALISNAIRDRKQASFTYLRYNEKKRLIPRRELPYTVEPRYIVFQDSRAYLIVTSDHHEGFGHYRLDRMKDIRILADSEVPPLPSDTNLDAYQYARNMYYMFNDGTTGAILRCETRILDHVIDIFGTDCSIIPSDSEHFFIHLQGSEKGILLFAQQYLDAAEILEPAELRSRMTKILADALSRYQ